MGPGSHNVTKMCHFLKTRKTAHNVNCRQQEQQVKHHVVIYLQKHIYHQVLIMGELVVVQRAYWVPSMDKNTHQMNLKMPDLLGGAISGLGKGKFCFVSSI